MPIIKTKHFNTTHGMTHSKEYSCWRNMLTRCYYKPHKSYRDYGAKGVSVCDRWRFSFENFLADMGLKPTAAHTIERKVSSGNYEPDNCIWATRMEQGLTRGDNHYLTLNNETHHIAEWARITGLKPSTISMRSRKRPTWTVERILAQRLRP